MRKVTRFVSQLTQEEYAYAVRRAADVALETNCFVIFVGETEHPGGGPGIAMVNHETVQQCAADTLVEYGEKVLRRSLLVVPDTVLVEYGVEVVTPGLERTDGRSIKMFRIADEVVAAARREVAEHPRDHEETSPEHWIATDGPLNVLSRDESARERVAVEKASADDSRWFSEHPNAIVRIRDAVEDEWLAVPIPPGIKVERMMTHVTQAEPGVRARRPIIIPKATDS